MIHTRDAMKPIYYLPDDRAQGARIGGALPRGQEKQAADADVQYFGTFPLLDNLNREFSVFHRMGVKPSDKQSDVAENKNVILTPSELIWATVHDKSERSETKARPFEARGITIGSESPDETQDDDGSMIPYTESKLGGRSFLERFWLQDEVDALEAEGFQLLVQVGLHWGDSIHGFPWDPGFLHVWAQDPENPSSYRFMVEQ